MERVRWGIIGCGDVTEVKSGPAFQMIGNSELVAVMRRNGELARDYAQRHKVPKWFDDADKLINDPDVNAVYVATPPSLHKEFTLAAANAGKPIYVEKPMAMNYSECDEMIKACDDAGVPLFVAYYRRALPKFLKIKELIDKEAIGKVCNVNLRLFQPPFEHDLKRDFDWHVDPTVAGCGYFCDLAPHQIDILQYYFGNIISAKGMKVNQSKLYKAEDAVTAIFKFPNDVIGTGNWNFNSYKEIDETEIIGSSGRITLSTFNNAPVTLETELGAEKFVIENPVNIQLPLIQNIVDELLGTGKSPSTGRSAAVTNKIMDQILFT